MGRSRRKNADTEGKGGILKSLKWMLGNNVRKGKTRDNLDYQVNPLITGYACS